MVLTPVPYIPPHQGPPLIRSLRPCAFECHLRGPQCPELSQAPTAGKPAPHVPGACSSRHQPPATQAPLPSGWRAAWEGGAAAGRSAEMRSGGPCFLGGADRGPRQFPPFPLFCLFLPVVASVKLFVAWGRS